MRTVAPMSNGNTTSGPDQSRLIPTGSVRRRREVAGEVGAQAGEGRLREVISAGGFTRFRRAAETPFNLILEARP